MADQEPGTRAGKACCAGRGHRGRADTTSLKCFLLAAWVAGCVLAGSAVAQSPSSQPSAPSVLEVKVREVVLDVVVTDAKGNYVTGLKQSDFTVFEDNVHQQIMSFRGPPAGAAGTGATAQTADASPEVHSSADLVKVGDRTLTILVLDELNTKFEDMAYARDAMQKWLSRQPARLRQPTVLLVASDEKFGVIHDYTEDRDALLLALKQHFPSYPFRMSKGGSIGPDAGERLALSLGSLVQIAQASSGTSGRKNVVWVGVGFPSLLLDDVSGTKEDEITAAARSATDVLLQARVTLNVVDPTAQADSSIDLNNPDQLSLSVVNQVGAETGTQPNTGYLNFSTFAPATGGTIYRGRNDVDREIQQAVDNGANFYTLTYKPTNKSNDAGILRNIRVVMSNPALHATTRNGYFPTNDRSAGGPLPPPPARELAFDFTSAALSSISYTGLTIKAERQEPGYLLKMPGGQLSPHVLPDGARIDEVTVMQVCFNAHKKVIAHQLAELQTRLPAEMSPGSLIDFRFSPANIPQGTVRVRLVVRDAVSGHIGTLDIDHP